MADSISPLTGDQSARLGNSHERTQEDALDYRGYLSPGVVPYSSWRNYQIELPSDDTDTDEEDSQSNNDKKEDVNVQREEEPEGNGEDHDEAQEETDEDNDDDDDEEDGSEEGEEDEEDSVTSSEDDASSYENESDSDSSSQGGVSVVTSSEDGSQSHDLSSDDESISLYRPSVKVNNTLKGRSWMNGDQNIRDFLSKRRTRNLGPEEKYPMAESASRLSTYKAATTGQSRRQTSSLARHRTIWTTAETQRLMDLCTAGVAIADMPKEFPGRSIGAVITKRLVLMKALRFGKRAPPLPKSQADVVKASIPLYSRRTKWTYEEKNLLVSLWRSGASSESLKVQFPGMTEADIERAYDSFKHILPNTDRPVEIPDTAKIQSSHTDQLAAKHTEAAPWSQYEIALLNEYIKRELSIDQMVPLFHSRKRDELVQKRHESGLYTGREEIWGEAETLRLLDLRACGFSFQELQSVFPYVTVGKLRQRCGAAARGSDLRQARAIGDAPCTKIIDKDTVQQTLESEALPADSPYDYMPIPLDTVQGAYAWSADEIPTSSDYRILKTASNNLRCGLYAVILSLNAQYGWNNLTIDNLLAYRKQYQQDIMRAWQDGMDDETVSTLLTLTNLNPHQILRLLDLYCADENNQVPDASPSTFSLGILFDQKPPMIIERDRTLSGSGILWIHSNEIDEMPAELIRHYSGVARLETPTMAPHTFTSPEVTADNFFEDKYGQLEAFGLQSAQYSYTQAFPGSAESPNVFSPGSDAIYQASFSGEPGVYSSPAAEMFDHDVEPDTNKIPCPSSHCLDCNEMFRTEKEAFTHDKTHFGRSKEFPCPLRKEFQCEERFYTMILATRHSDGEHLGRPQRVPCPVARYVGCWENFESADEARHHQLTHHVEFPCTVAKDAECTDMFHNPKSAESHARLHHPFEWYAYLALPFKCPLPRQIMVCTEHFATKDEMVKHVREKHKKYEHITLEDKWPCPLAKQLGCGATRHRRCKAIDHAHFSHGGDPQLRAALIAYDAFYQPIKTAIAALRTV